MATKNSPKAKTTREQVAASDGKVIIPATSALPTDSDAMKQLLDLLRAHPECEGDKTVAVDVSESRTDVLVTLKAVKLPSGELDTAAFDSGAAMQFAVDAVAKMGLTISNIGKSHPRFQLRDVRQPAKVPATVPSEEPKA